LSRKLRNPNLDLPDRESFYRAVAEDTIVSLDDSIALKECENASSLPAGLASANVMPDHAVSFSLDAVSQCGTIMIAYWLNKELLPLPGRARLDSQVRQSREHH